MTVCQMSQFWDVLFADSISIKKKHLFISRFLLRNQLFTEFDMCDTAHMMPPAHLTCVRIDSVEVKTVVHTYLFHWGAAPVYSQG